LSAGPDSTAAPARGRGRLFRPAEKWGWAAWTVVIVFVSVVPAEWLFGPAPRQAWSALASAAHFLEYLVLTLLLLWFAAARRRDTAAAAGGAASGSRGGREPAREAVAGKTPAGRTNAPGAGVPVVLAVAASLAIAGVVELVQWPLPYRSFDPIDLLTDAAGAGVAAACFVAVGRLRAHR